MDRYVNETNRLHGVLDRRLAGNQFLGGGEYSIADIATYPWVTGWKRQLQNLDEHPHLKRWFDAVAARPATVRAYERANDYKSAPITGEAQRALLFGQTSASVAQAAKQAAGAK
jgi:GST-like protein